MRIIAGEHRGRKLAGPDDQFTTRPITDRVKTSLFDRLSSAGRIEDALVLDLFSGTGSLGIECLSRAAEAVCFVERDRGALRKLRDNLAMIGDPSHATVIGGDALSAALIDRLPRRDLTLIFFDPPYRMVEDARQGPKLWAQMTRLAAVSAPDAMMILRCAGGASVPEVEGWSASARYDYGGMSLYHLLCAP